MNDLNYVGVDDVLESLGSYGKYQIIHFFLSTLTFFSEAYQQFSIVFIGQANAQRCAPPPSLPPNQMGNVFGECSISNQNETNVSSCIYGYKYQYPTDMSIISDFDLVCERSGLADLSQTMLNFGMAIGSSTLTLASDKYGRKPVSVFSHLVVLATGLGVAFSPNYTVLIVMRFLNGIVIQGTILAAVTYGVEMFPKEKRRFCGVFTFIVWSICMMTVSPIAYLARQYSWRMVYLSLTAISLYSLLQYWITDESIRWLVANNRLEETVKVIKKAAKMNGVNDNEPLRLLSISEKQTDTLLDPTLDSDKELKEETIIIHPEKYTLLDIFKSKRLAITLIIIWFTWFTNSLTYFGIYLSSSSLAGNIYLNFFLNALVEAPAALIYWFTIDSIGRKKTCILFHVIATFGLIAATIVKVYANDNESVSTAATVFALIGKLGISGSFNVLFTYTPEIFPTNIRNIAFGTSCTSGRIAGMLAPFSSLLAVKIPWAPGAIFGVSCFFTTLSILYLPETMGKELPQTMDDLNKLYDK